MNRTTDSKRRAFVSPRTALREIYEWAENSVPFGVPLLIALRVEAALEPEFSTTDRWHVRDADPLTVLDQNGLFVAAFNVAADAALAARAPEMFAVLCAIASGAMDAAMMKDLAAKAAAGEETIITGAMPWCERCKCYHHATSPHIR